jgi:hypothetical protein
MTVGDRRGPVNPAEARERDLHVVRLAQVLRDRRVDRSRDPERGEARFPECLEDGAVRIRLARRDPEIADDRDGVNLEARQLLTEQALQRIDGASDRANGENPLNSSGHRPPPLGDDSFASTNDAASLALATSAACCLPHSEILVSDQPGGVSEYSTLTGTSDQVDVAAT